MIWRWWWRWWWWSWRWWWWWWCWWCWCWWWRRWLPLSLSLLLFFQSPKARMAGTRGGGESMDRGRKWGFFTGGWHTNEIWLVVWNHGFLYIFMTFHMLGIIIPTDFHIENGWNHQPVIENLLGLLWQWGIHINNHPIMVIWMGERDVNHQIRGYHIFSETYISGRFNRSRWVKV